MTQTYATGAQSVVLFGYEALATWGTEVTGTNPFGQGVDITPSRRNNMERIYGIGARNAAVTVAKQYEGSLAINFTLANGNFFYGLLGTLVEGGGGGPTYTHTYTEADTLPSFSVDNSVEMGTNDMVSAYLGCMTNTCTITSSVNETVKVSLDCFYKTETLGTSGVFNHVAETEGSFTFAQGTLEIPNATTIATVQTFELTLTNNLEYIFGLASRFAAAGVGKQREFNFRLTAAFNDVTKLLTYFLDGTNTATAPDAATPTPHATMELTFTNAGAGALLESIVLLFANVYFDEETLPQSVNEVIKEDITGHALSCTSVVWTNNSATVMALG